MLLLPTTITKLSNKSFMALLVAIAKKSIEKLNFNELCLSASRVFKA